MWIDLASKALRSGKVLELSYDGWRRWVEVHAVGYSKDGNPLMRVWQTRGGSNSDERQGWKLMRCDEAFAATITEEVSEAPRKGYRRGDPALSRIMSEL